MDLKQNSYHQPHAQSFKHQYFLLLFVYSDSSRDMAETKLALLIGPSYSEDLPFFDVPLRGVANDLQLMKDMLCENGFQSENIKVCRKFLNFQSLALHILNLSLPLKVYSTSSLKGRFFKVSIWKLKIRFEISVFSGQQLFLKAHVTFQYLKKGNKKVPI